jgi:hypothetical protein
MAGDLVLITHIPLDPEAVRARCRAPQTHFGKRAAARGVRSVPGDVLAHAVEQALAQGRQDMLDRLWPTVTGNMVYRFAVREGCFYAIVSPQGVAVTLYTQAMISGMRQARRAIRRAGRRDNKPALWERVQG